MSDDRPTLIARITALIDARDRLVTDLLRTGADPEWVAQRACTDTWPTKAPTPDAGTCAMHPPPPPCPPLPFTGLRCANPEPLPHDYCWGSTCWAPDKHDEDERRATA